MSAIVSVSSEIIARNRTSLGSHLMFSGQYGFWRTPASQTFIQQASIRIVRISDYINPCTSWNATTHSGTYNWTDIDAVLSLNKQLGVKTLLALGFYSPSGWNPIGNMPLTTTGLPSLADYAGYVRDIVTHVESRGFDVPFYELVNEAWFYFYTNWTWNETKALNFLALYNAGYDAVKSVAPSALCGTDSSLYPRFNTFWKANSGRLDFLSGHKYDGWGKTYPDSQGLDSAEKKFFTYYDANHMSVAEARAFWEDENLLALFTESNFNAVYEGGTDPRIHNEVGQAWCGIVAMNCIRHGVDYFHYFDWNGGPASFGLINSTVSPPQPYEYTYPVLRDIFSNLSVNDEVLRTTVSGNASVKAQAWRHNGVVYCIIVNRDSAPVSVTFEGQVINFPTYGTQLIRVAGAKYVFSHWQDGDTNPVKTITV